MCRHVRKTYVLLALSALLAMSACEPGNLSGRGGSAIDGGDGGDLFTGDAGEGWDVQDVELEGDSGGAEDVGETGVGDVSEGPDVSGEPDADDVPVWACEEAVSCDEVNMTTTLGQMRELDGCAFELRLQAPIEDGEALADRLLARV